MKKKPDLKEQIWIALFLVMPAIIISNFNEFIVDASLDRILLAGLFGGLGAAIGAILFQLTKNKSTLLRVLTLVLITAISFSALLYLNKNKTFSTCEICGYKAIKKNSRECSYCGTLTWKEVKKLRGYSDKELWLKEEQLFFFNQDSHITNFDFFSPSVDDGYIKDKTWKPIITIEDLNDELANNEN